MRATSLACRRGARQSSTRLTPRRRVRLNSGHGKSSPLPGVHDLRHYFASLLIHKGLSVKAVQIGSPAEQDAAMATARALGAEVWAVGAEPELEWQVTLPGEPPRMIRPRRHARPRQL